MIGFYDYTVVLTYMSLMTSIFGIMQAIDGRLRTAIVCLALSGLLDMFDGKVARTKKDRTYDEKLFGVQIDSLCDVICFGVFPGVISYMLGVRGPLGAFVIAFFGVAAVIRLAFFNVLETNRQASEEGCNKYYHGLPVTSIAIIFPLVFLLNFFVSPQVFRWILLLMLLTVGILFITNFKLRKPSMKQLSSAVVIVGCAVIIILLFSKYKIIHSPLHEKASIEIHKIAD